MKTWRFVCETFSYNICAEVEKKGFPIRTFIPKQHLLRWAVKGGNERRKKPEDKRLMMWFVGFFAETQHAEAAGPEHCHDGDVAGGAERAVAAGAVRGLPAQRGAPLLTARGVGEPRPGAPHRGAQGGALGHPQLHDWCQEALHALLRARVSVRELLAPSPLSVFAFLGILSCHNAFSSSTSVFHKEFQLLVA